MTEPFNGAKLAILFENQIVLILRDEIPTIPWPGRWDMPGGGREGDETPEACVLRELEEELGIRLPERALVHKTKVTRGRGTFWFFAAELAEFDPASVVLGDEGQTWKLAPIDWFLNEENAIPTQQQNLRNYLAARR